MDAKVSAGRYIERFEATQDMTWKIVFCLAAQAMSAAVNDGLIVVPPSVWPDCTRADPPELLRPRPPKETQNAD